MSPPYVIPYVKVHKNDDRDAEAIAEAVTRPTMPFVAIKSEEQLDLQALHCSRERLAHNRTRLINQAPGFLMERGIRIGQGRHVFQRALSGLIADRPEDLSPLDRHVPGYGGGTRCGKQSDRRTRCRDQNSRPCQ
jgi:transposase